MKPLSKWTAVKPNQTEATANQTSKENAFPGIPLNQINNTWFQQARDHLHSNLQLGPRRHTAKNAILFIGDGMGPSTVTAARLRHGQLRNASGEEGLLSWERLPWSALVKTYNLDAQVGDSAATAGALVTGVLTNQGEFDACALGHKRWFWWFGCSVYGLTNESLKVEEGDKHFLLPFHPRSLAFNLLMMLATRRTVSKSCEVLKYLK